MLQNTEHLSKHHRSQGVALLQEFEDVISKSEGDLGQTSSSFHTIDTGDNQPIRQHARRLPVHQHKEVSELIQGMLSRGIIECSSSPWASPVVLVRKKDGTTRFCVDFRKLNDCTRKDAQPLPRIDESLDALGGACFFSTLDLASGYWQVLMDPKSKEKTAFTTPYGLYQFRVMPFGLCNAPATFQRLMERVLSGLHWTACLVYLDDIIIFSKTVEQHLALLRDVFSRLRQAGLKIKPSKCHLLQTSVHYLGHVVSAKGIETDPGKVKCVSNWPVPTTSKELSSFLGLASYYRRFIKNFAHVAAPLHALIHKGKSWQWSAECTEAFFELKKRLISAPVLMLPDFSKSFVLDTDASGEGLGAVLSQIINGKEHVISYASRTLSHTEKRYCATRREMLALVWGSRHFRPYLYGRKFLLRTDHNSLCWLHNFKEPEGQVARWLETMAEFQYEVIHRPGKQHSNADSLSRGQCRQCGLEIELESDEMFPVCEISLLPAWTNQEVADFQRADGDLEQVITWLQSGSVPQQCPKESTWRLQSLWTQCKNLLLKDGILYRQWEDIPGGGQDRYLQLVIPPTHIPGIMVGLHDSHIGGHMGVRKTWEKIRRRFYWPGQKSDVVKWCSNCIACNSRKSPPRNKAPLEVSHASRPLERIAMDIMGPLPETPRGNRYIIVIGDYFTKWKEAYPLPNMEALSIAKVLVSEFICRFGVPDSIHTDQGKNFEAKVIQEICHLLGVTKTRTTPYHPQSDGLVERFNRTLLDMLSITVADEHDWDLSLPMLLLAYRTSVQETTGTTPFQLMFGRNPRLPEDVLYSLPATSYDSVSQYTKDLKGRLQRSYQAVIEHVQQKQTHQKDVYDRGVRGSPYSVGDLVLLHSPVVPRGKSWKLHKPWQGPYRVVKAISPSVYRIVDCARPRCKRVVHFNRLKPAPLANVPIAERVVNQKEHMEHSGDTAEVDEEEELEFTEIDQPVIIPQDAVEVNQPPIAVLPTPTVIDAPPQHAIPQNAALPIPPQANNRDVVPAGLRRSSRKTKPPERYGNPITLPDVWSHLIEEDAV